MCRVLLIDDDPIEAKLLSAFLRSRYDEAAYEVTHAIGLEEGLRALQRQTFDYILLDNRLPPFRDYRQTLPTVRLFSRGVEPIVVSASTIDACFGEAGAFGDPAVIDKFHLKASIQGGLLG